MAADKCLHCGSKYITFVEKKDSFEKTTEVYYCLACKQKFNVDAKKRSADGTWLMTVYDDPVGASYKKELQIYRTKRGYKLNQKINDRYITRTVTPKAKVEYNQYTGRYYLWFDTFALLDDSEGCYLTATKVELNPELTEEALKCEAMRIVHKGGNKFAIGEGYKENTLPVDIKAWFDKALKAPYRVGGCYVATCVYGSYDCPQVWVLRRFRDNTLAPSFAGRIFVRAYYAVSPTLVRLFGNAEWFKRILRPFLDKTVEKLRLRGVEDTPYHDPDPE